MRILLAAMLLLFAASCNDSTADGIVDVAIIGSEDDLFAEGLRLDPAGQLIRGATAQGLVRLDQAGQVVPALAERWIVTDDGASYIFRIREFDLPDGERLTAQKVRDSLARTIARLEGTSLGLDLAKISDIRAMTGRVIEIRLKSPMPGLLQVLAQPELAVLPGKAQGGPMAMARVGRTAVLDALPPEARGLPSQPDWDEGVMQVRAAAVDAREATAGFSEDRYDLILNGRISDLPLAITGALSRGTIRLDSAVGLFGLDVVNTEGFLSEPENREALAMAIDRTQLLEPFNIGGWMPTTRLVPAALAGDPETVSERWDELSIEQRQAQAAARVRQWQAANGEKPVIRVALPPGPGSRLLFQGLARDFAAIGVGTIQVAPDEDPDLALRDRVARYGNASWFLNQFNCRITRPCSPDADFLVGLSVDAANAAEEVSYLAEAEATLTAANYFIPLGAPIRWSQVRADVEGFIENSWNVHPLFPLSRAPI